MSKKVGIIGGTFNPIHMGHLILAEHALSDFGLDKILFIPTGISHFKDPNIVLDKHVRFEMTKLATEDDPYFEVSSVEVDREGNSYTAETLQILTKADPDARYYLILGADTLIQIEMWKDPDVIMKHAGILAAVREGSSTEELEAKAKKLAIKYDTEISLLSMPYIDISSTEIRNRIKNGKSVRYMVPDKTLEYINKNGLYR